jgi:hypothetical protein
MMAKIFDLHCGEEGDYYVALSDLASTPDKFMGLISLLPYKEFLTIFVYEQNKMGQTDPYKFVKSFNDCFVIETEYTTCDWFDFFVYSVENKNNNIVVLFKGMYNCEDICCFHQDEGFLLVNPDTKAIENYKDSNVLFKGVKSFTDSSGIIFNNIQAFSPGRGIAFDNSEDFKEDILSRSKNRVLIKYDVWEEQTWKLICDFNKILEVYKDKILIHSTGSEFEDHSILLKAVEEKIIGYKKRLNK